MQEKIKKLLGRSTWTPSTAKELQAQSKDLQLTC